MRSKSSHRRQSKFYIRSDDPDRQGDESYFSRRARKNRHSYPLTVWIFLLPVLRRKRGTASCDPAPGVWKRLPDWDDGFDAVHIYGSPFGELGLAGTQTGLYSTAKFDITVHGTSARAGPCASGGMRRRQRRLPGRDRHAGVPPGRTELQPPERGSNLRGQYTGPCGAGAAQYGAAAPVRFLCRRGPRPRRSI